MCLHGQLPFGPSMRGPQLLLLSAGSPIAMDELLRLLRAFAHIPARGPYTVDARMARGSWRSLSVDSIDMGWPGR